MSSALVKHIVDNDPESASDNAPYKMNVTGKLKTALMHQIAEVVKRDKPIDSPEFSHGLQSQHHTSAASIEHRGVIAVMRLHT